jgi:hypothetical protein
MSTGQEQDVPAIWFSEYYKGLTATKVKHHLFHCVANEFYDSIKQGHY